ncbi:MAG: exodeoxyribonuclease VII small subunit [Gammaproteobacteria bacterium]|uniref:Exodeoxyribonuclease 7 small subunit n=1 Tax=OM182 bacterium MED-G24 TaxID=1986255 RepID=A0A2A5WUY9_9GAMM|nr:exodeoxyribonuclease VII small subunit [Gammaproteobacteria bacterium]PDH40312.1 MAG: exodeoxyribonuclease VII small subunit [OM182 bacterium MED-G24]RPG23122.1 MAG: exodeoxyribonuclease VII small subunit [Gammaproteobacteria bacterium TMED50]|tara:strand:- start:415 stop:654 length:240 start_codon:yes stop_codon:yes gene_type:complete
MAKEKTPYPFENALERLEALVVRMESGDLSLEESMHTFEEGVKLTRECQQALQEAELKVNELVKKQGEVSLVPFDADDR